MSKFKIGDRVKFHMEWYPEVDDIGTVCEGPYEVIPDHFWDKWDRAGAVSYSHEDYLTLIESAKQGLPTSFKIDVQAYADENNISLGQAHNEIQPWLFENGNCWTSGIKDVSYTNKRYLFCESNLISFDSYEKYFSGDISKQIFLSRNVSVSLFVKEEEIVEILGKKYRKGDVEKALKNIQCEENT